MYGTKKIDFFLKKFANIIDITKINGKLTKNTSKI